MEILLEIPHNQAIQATKVLKIYEEQPKDYLKYFIIHLKNHEEAAK